MVSLVNLESLEMLEHLENLEETVREVIVVKKVMRYGSTWTLIPQYTLAYRNVYGHNNIP